VQGKVCEGRYLVKIGKDGRSNAGNGKQSGATSCPAREPGEMERTRGRLRRLDTYCVVWHSADGDYRFNQYVAAISVRDAERRSKDDIQMALGQNARYWHIGDIRVEAPSRLKTRRPGNVFGRLLDRCRRGTRLFLSKLARF
jgi:hypothetical protein